MPAPPPTDPLLIEHCPVCGVPFPEDYTGVETTRVIDTSTTACVEFYCDPNDGGCDHTVVLAQGSLDDVPHGRNHRDPSEQDPLSRIQTFLARSNHLPPTSQHRGAAGPADPWRSLSVDAAVLLTANEEFDYDARLRIGRHLQERVWLPRFDARARAPDEPLRANDTLLALEYRQGDYADALLALRLV